MSCLFSDEKTSHIFEHSVRVEDTNKAVFQRVAFNSVTGVFIDRGSLKMCTLNSVQFETEHVRKKNGKLK